MNSLLPTLELYGAEASFIRFFDEDGPDLLPYATLISARNTGDEDFLALRAVYEWQSTPLIFLISGEDIRDESHFKRIRRCVALRGDAPYLGVVQAGQISFHHVSLDAKGSSATRFQPPALSEAGSTFVHIANNRPGASTQRKWISHVVLKLLKETIGELARNNVIPQNDVISLAGRALFIRFLGDRNLIPTDFGPVGQIFDNLDSIANINDWLDETFNGDFLPLSKGLLTSTTIKALLPLGNILRRAPEGQMYLGWEEKWDYLDFAHIPVGVLSEAYEGYMREHDPDRQRKEGSYYTPRQIVDLMVKGSFLALRRQGTAHTAKVLDPSAGAGIFLVSSFVQLVIERWHHDGKQPDTQILRDILYNQIAGFDINEAAMRFAALGLYLISIEIDPVPEPVEKLRFNRNLRGHVLHDLNANSEDGLGSLGSAVGQRHQHQYDLVIGNPPWSSATGLGHWSIVKNIVGGIAQERLGTGIELDSLLPNEVLDLPFVWRSMEWAKPNGQIAFALHSRLLFQQSDGMPSARSALFNALDVTGVINGTELRSTKVWPVVLAPFCLLFARNCPPLPDAVFRFVTPRLEESLNRAGIMRIDTANATLVNPRQLASRPELLKILFRGNKLDLRVFDKIMAQNLPTVNAYWQRNFGCHKGSAAQAGNGYQKTGASSRVRKGETEGGVSAEYLHGFSELNSTAFESNLIDPEKLTKFMQPRIHDRRPVDLFRGPLLLVRESPSAGANRIQVSVSDGNLVFNKSYQGYSAFGHPEARLLVRYLALLINSKFAIWYSLMCSGRFGVEREVIESITIDQLPFVAIENLNNEVRGRIDTLFGSLVEDESHGRAAIDAWIASIYGLTERDVRVIDDTVKYNLPFAGSKSAAQQSPSKDQMRQFCNELSETLSAWARRENLVITIEEVALDSTLPWSVVVVSASVSLNSAASSALFKEHWQRVIKIADSLAATEIVHPDATNRCIWIAQLKQARYWSSSQSQLIASRIVWDHFGALLGSN